MLEEKVAIITGGGTGIGRAIARTFYENGANLVLTGRREAVLEEARGIIGADPLRCRIVAADVTREEDVRRIVDESLKAFGGIDILVNGAGVMIFRSVEEATMEFLTDIFRVNTFAPAVLTAAVLPHMRERKGGAILNISSLSGIRPAAGSSVYCASKAAVKMFTEVTALETARDNIRVNCIAPGLVEDTGLGREMFSEDQARAAYKRFSSLHPLGRNGKPEEIAEAALFLCSEKSAWITGAVIPVDGGRNLTMNG